MDEFFRGETDAGQTVKMCEATTELSNPIMGIDKIQTCTREEGHSGSHSNKVWTWPHSETTGPRMIDTVDESPVTPQQKQEKILRYEWDRLNAEEANKVVPKAIEYGSGDLKLMGYALKLLLNSPRARARNWTEPESEEIACTFYILGKVARMLSAYERGAMPADDQPHDIGVYTRMIQILRRTGSWPPGFEEYLKETT